MIRPDGGVAIIGARDVTVPGEPVSSDQMWVRLLTESGSPGAVDHDYAALDEIDKATLGTQTADGNLLAARATRVGTSSTTALALARWTPEGKLDTTLGGTGKLKVAAMHEPVGLMALPDGRFLVAGLAADAEHTPAPPASGCGSGSRSPNRRASASRSSAVAGPPRSSRSTGPPVRIGCVHRASSSAAATASPRWPPTRCRTRASRNASASAPGSGPVA